jgi:protein phosphatase
MTNEKTNLRFVSASVTDKGLSQKRPLNEDSYLEMVDRGLFAVADGVGGAQAGEVASQMAMETLYEAFSNHQPNVDTEELMEMAIQRANQAIFQMSRELPQLDTMATTIVTLHLDGNIATIGHVGDSRLYRLDARGNLFRETQDHSVVEEEVRAGRMTLAQAANHPSRNVISRALGAEQTVEVDMKTILFEPGTTFLICSDGITRHVEDAEMRNLLMQFKSPSEICSELKEICYQRGAEDNLTAVVIRAEENAAFALEDEEEATLAGVRPAFVDSLIQTPPETVPLQARTDTAPELLHEPIPNVPQTAPLAVVAPVAASIPPKATEIPVENENAAIQTKLDNERLRAKINAAEPVADTNFDTPKRGGGIGRIFGWLILLLLGAALGAGAFYAWNEYQKSQNPPPQTQPQTVVRPNPQADVGMTEAEINEYKSFEKLRRSSDKNPTSAINALQTETAADYYLRGRAFLQTGKTEEALAALRKANQLLPQTEGIDRDMLRVDIAFASAALAAVANNPNEEKALNDLINEKKTQSVPAAQ